jgi:antitoxin (DNA-binding transcriptional repressor) of toxin-antitoxin stability system
MTRIKAVGVKELKNRLSAYLREVRDGTVILVTDRETVVAELHEPTVGRPPEDGDPLEKEWIREGSLIPPRRRKEPLTLPALRFPEGAAKALLDADRGE